MQLSDYDVNNRYRVEYDVVFTLREPLSHIGKSIGNVQNLNTIDVTTLDGRAAKTFVFSANAQRGYIFRRVGGGASLDDLGVTVSPNVHQTLFSGGRIDGSTGNDLALETKIRKALPWLSVLGTAKPAGMFGESKAMMIAGSGRFRVHDAYLICYESAAFVPTRFLPPDAAVIVKWLEDKREESEMRRCPDGVTDLCVYGTDSEREAYADWEAAYRVEAQDKVKTLRQILGSWSEHTTVNTAYKHDSLKSPELARYLAPTTNKALPKGKQTSLLGDGESESPSGKAEKEDTAKSDQMIFQSRLIQAGERLYARWSFNGTDVEEGFLYFALDAFSKEPYLGGQRRAGRGLVDVEIHYRVPATGEHGKLLSLGQNLLQLGERAKEKKARYDDFLNTYKEQLSDGSDESRFLLGDAK